jgi:8-oxo-dGTP diphosphatase
MIKFDQMQYKPETPKVGVGVVLRNPQDKVLLMLRKGSHGAGQWSLPGGHMELGETFLKTCKREVLEEVDILIDDITPITFTNDIMENEGLHYITLFFEASYKYQLPYNVEPEKCSELKWFTREEISALPNLFSPLSKILIKI